MEKKEHEGLSSGPADDKAVVVEWKLDDRDQLLRSVSTLEGEHPPGLEPATVLEAWSNPLSVRPPQPPTLQAYLENVYGMEPIRAILGEIEELGALQGGAEPKGGDEDGLDAGRLHMTLLLSSVYDVFSRGSTATHTHREFQEFKTLWGRLKKLVDILVK